MNYISILPLDYSKAYSSPSSAAYGVIRDYSRGMDAIKAYPQDEVLGVKNAPHLDDLAHCDHCKCDSLNHEDRNEDLGRQ